MDPRPGRRVLRRPGGRRGEHRDKALDDCTRLAIGAGFDALRDAGIPLVMHYKTTTVGTKLPEHYR